MKTEAAREPARSTECFLCDGRKTVPFLVPGIYAWTMVPCPICATASEEHKSP